MNTVLNVAVTVVGMLIGLGPDPKVQRKAGSVSQTWLTKLERTHKNILFQISQINAFDQQLLQCWTSKQKDAGLNPTSDPQLFKQYT